MLKNDLIKNVSDKTGQTRETVRAIFDATLESTLESIRKGEDVMLIGLGKLTTLKRGPKSARNIRTGESVVVAPRTVAHFRPSTQLASAANGE